MSKKQSSNRRGTQQLFYTEAFKQKIVNEVLSGKLNKRQASLIYGIKGNATILYWICKLPQKQYVLKVVRFINFKNVKDEKKSIHPQIHYHYMETRKVMR